MSGKYNFYNFNLLKLAKKYLPCILETFDEKTMMHCFYSSPPASKASREVENLIDRKNPHTHVYGVKECVCLLSICDKLC